MANGRLEAEITNYALTFIDYFGYEQLINSEIEIVTFQKKPFYKSSDNAVSGAKKATRNAKHTVENVGKHWYDKAIDQGFKVEDMTRELCSQNYGENWAYGAMKRFKDAELIVKNGLNIREVSIKLV